MDIVLLFPGQGSQKVGMGHDLCEHSSAARAVFDEVDEATGCPISTLAFSGPTEELTLTHNAQPALLAHSAAAWAMLQPAIAPHVRAAAGHSLGEFSAYHAAGAMTLSAAARLVRARGSLMYETGRATPGAMAAILGTLSTSIDDLCRQASHDDSLVVPANYNSAEQTVISGEREAVARAMVLAKEAGAKRCLPLPVSGAFHSPLMRPAEAGLGDALREAAIGDPKVPVYANVNAEPVTTGAMAQSLLLQQLTSPVQWLQIMQRLLRDYPQALFVELGTGAVLSGLARRMAADVRTMSVGSLQEVEQLLELAAGAAHAH